MGHEAGGGVAEQVRSPVAFDARGLDDACEFLADGFGIGGSSGWGGEHEVVIVGPFAAGEFDLGILPLPMCAAPEAMK